MGKGGSFNITRHGGASARGGGAMRCISCGIHIFYGDRCPPCQQRLRERRRRKPR